MPKAFAFQYYSPLTLTGELENLKTWSLAWHSVAGCACISTKRRPSMASQLLKGLLATGIVSSACSATIPLFLGQLSFYLSIYRSAYVDIIIFTYGANEKPNWFKFSLTSRFMLLLLLLLLYYAPTQDNGNKTETIIIRHWKCIN